MPKYEACGNEYDQAIIVEAAGALYTQTALLNAAPVRFPTTRSLTRLLALNQERMEARPASRAFYFS